MAYSENKDKDLLKLISEILEYTENATPTNTPPPTTPPPCACKADGGNCGDDTSLCPPKPDGTYDITSCTCPNGSMIFCPKCPDPCKCKTDGGGCGDDTSTCDPKPDGTYDTVDCYDSSGLTCNVCPKCPVITPTPVCSCGDCGLAYFDIGNCTKTTCDCGIAMPNGNCYDCPVNTNTPTQTCGPCFCDSGTICGACIPGLERCVNQKIQTCAPGCAITCGECEPYPTDTPTPTATDTILCSCDCADFSSESECKEWIRVNAVGGPWYCKSNPCSAEDGDDCMTNANCRDLSDEPPETETPTGTCPPQDCSKCNNGPTFGYPSGSNCKGCTLGPDDICIKCFQGNCKAPNGCPNYACDFCYHQTRVCGSQGGYRTKEDCDNALKNIPNLTGEVLSCVPANIKHNSCVPPVIEICWQIQAVPTITPTNTVCDCADFSQFGYVNVGACQERGAFATDTLSCPLGGTIDCDICNTPTPTNTCKCTDIVTGGIGNPGACFSSEPSCTSYKETLASSYDCTCSENTTGCPGSTCYCANCTPITVTPQTITPITPTPTFSCVPPPNCCVSQSAALALTNGKCADSRCCTKSSFINSVSNPNNPPGCPKYDCWGVTLAGSNLITAPIGMIVNGICYTTQRSACTSATSPLCGTPPRAVYAEVYGGYAPNDGDYSTCS